MEILEDLRPKFLEDRHLAIIANCLGISQEEVKEAVNSSASSRMDLSTTDGRIKLLAKYLLTLEKFNDRMISDMRELGPRLIDEFNFRASIKNATADIDEHIRQLRLSSWYYAPGKFD